MNYVYLSLAILLDIAATVTVKATDGFTRPLYTAIVIACMGFSMYAFALCLSSLDVSTAYTIWTGLEFVGIALLGWCLYGQKLNGTAILGIAVVMVGVGILHLSSHSVEAASQG